MDDIKNLYTEENCEYGRKTPGWRAEESAWKATQISTLLGRHAISGVMSKTNSDRPFRVAEVGCGAGEILNQMRLRYPECVYVGYDIAKDAMNMARTRETDNLTFVHGDIFESGDLFDLLLVVDVFEHVPDYYGFLDMCRSKATYKLFHIPLDVSLINILLNRFDYLYESGGHIHFFTDSSALLTLKNCGYEILGCQFTMRTRAFLNEKTKLTTRLAALPRTLMNWISPRWTARMVGGGSLLVLAK